MPPAFKRAYDVTPDGNWEGHTILRRVTPPGDAGAGSRARARPRPSVRRPRAAHPPRPRRQGAGRLERPRHRRARPRRRRVRAPRMAGPRRGSVRLHLAQMAAPDGRVQHAWRLGRVTAAGLLDDQAAMARAALALYEATGDARPAGPGGPLADARPTSHFADGAGSFFTTADDAADVPLARPRTAARQRDARRQRPDGRGVRPPVPPHRRARLARPRRGRAARLHRPARPARRHARLLAAADLLEEAATVVIAGPADRTSRSWLPLSPPQTPRP